MDLDVKSRIVMEKYIHYKEVSLEYIKLGLDKDELKYNSEIELLCEINSLIPSGANDEASEQILSNHLKKLFDFIYKLWIRCAAEELSRFSKNCHSYNEKHLAHYNKLSALDGAPDPAYFNDLLMSQTKKFST